MGEGEAVGAMVPWCHSEAIRYRKEMIKLRGAGKRQRAYFRNSPGV